MSGHDAVTAGGELDSASTVPGDTTRSPLVALPPGTRLGRYEIVEVLGSGGMGVVYRARDPALGRDVAVKLIHQYRAYLSDAGDREARLLREAQALARLSHPNVVAAYDVGTHDDAVFVAMELIAGVSLAAWLTGRRGFREVLDVLLAAGRGLAAAHAAGVLHRDFKPANVMVSPDRVRVVDFGLARAAAEPTSDAVRTGAEATDSGSLLASQLTRDGGVMGTPATR